MRKSSSRLGYSIDDVMEGYGLSKQTIYNEINSGRLRTFKVGRRRLVSPRALDAWVSLLEEKAS